MTPMIPFHELSKSAQDAAAEPIRRGFTVMARPYGRGHQLQLVFSDDEQNDLERQGWGAVEPSAPQEPPQ